MKGYDGSYYIIDHHHYLRAVELARPGKMVLISVQNDFSHLSKEQFWETMQKNNWCYLKDQNGKRISPDDLPHSLSKMKDDPYRSLLWKLAKEGYWQKTNTPFEEFLLSESIRERFKSLDLNDTKQIKEVGIWLKANIAKIRRSSCLRSAFD